MPRIITEILKRKAKDEYAVYIDGEHAFDVDAELLFRFALKAGEPIDSEIEEEIRHEAELSRAKGRALRLLGVRPRTIAELEGRLAQAEFSPGVISEVISWLSEIGYLNDEAFAKGWVDSRIRLKPMGARRLELELRQKGVAGETARAALAGVTEEREFEWALAIASQRLRRMEGVAREPARRRLFGLLQRRGFRPDVVRAVISRLLP